MPVAGCLLTGGSSRRLGIPKATLLLDGERLVDRATRALKSVCSPVLEVGPGYGSLPSVREDPPGEGPLSGLIAGAVQLAADGYSGPIVLLAVDLPFAESRLLEWLAAHPSTDSVVPRVDGVAQSLCARYTARATEIGAELLSRGEHSMRALLDAAVITYLDEDAWGVVAEPRAFLDVDTADDAARAGVQAPK